ncbi:MOP flippase family protein [Oscillatoria acuminata]|uniref:Membrane protein involved in the export of O-antigen and teichoic acid n=1 Tax=Oscillatoria acuminata PCC 6304 TaxID=56110 RepID=K9TGY6_9CYAN|nr:MOP flippase family protein [Oscillatoria acuminata]AFY81401.1 membrane protein involved in the export of O-antigen and teichoic acid [Oscillatoria acuminata PCC 6304]
MIKKTKVTSSFKWSLLSQLTRQVMQFVTTAILARLLSPSDFGLLGMASIVIGFVGLFMDLGTSAAVIQKKNISDSFLYSVFWMNVGFGFLAMLTLFSLSPLVASFYKEPKLTAILQVLSITFLISGLGILQKSLLERNLEFNKLAKIEIIAVVIGSILGITLAILKFGVWSLISQSLTGVCVTTLMLWFSQRWSPRLIFHWREISLVSNYSLNLTGFTIFNYFIRNADYLLIGKYLGSEDLGHYTLAYRLMLYPLQNISAVIGRVMFPVLCKIQDDNLQFRRVYLRITSCIALMAFPIMAGMWVIAEPLIITIFGWEWQPVIPLLMILAPVGLLQGLGTTVGTIYQAKGRTDWMLRWGIFAGTLVMLAFVIGLQWGIIGVAASYTVASLILTYPGFAIPFRLIQLSIIDYLSVVWRPFLLSFVMLILLIGIKLLLPVDFNRGWELVVLMSSGLIIYPTINFLINPNQIKELFNLLH